MPGWKEIIKDGIKQKSATGKTLHEIAVRQDPFELGRHIFPNPADLEYSREAGQLLRDMMDLGEGKTLRLESPGVCLHVLEALERDGIIKHIKNKNTVMAGPKFEESIQKGTEEIVKLSSMLSKGKGKL